MAIRSWLEQNPGLCLAIVAGLTAIAAAVEAIGRHRLRRALSALAGQWRMTYTPRDHLRLTSRIAARLPIPGAADVRVTDLIYGSRGNRFLYIFTAQYTVGVVRGKQRHLRVASYAEPRDRQSTEQPGPIVLAPEGKDLVEQYRSLAPAE
jgi:hypothetical protein